jgi:hypothetical protein
MEALQPGNGQAVEVVAEAQTLQVTAAMAEMEQGAQVAAVAAQQ